MPLQDRRRVLRGGLGLLLLASVGATQAATRQPMVSVGVSQSILRKGPSLRHEGLWSVPRGFPLQVVKRQGDWLQVRDFEGDLAWIRAAATSRQGHFIVKVPTANVRARPAANAPLAGQAKYGSLLRTLERRDGWVRVQPLPSGSAGWVAQRLLWGF